MWKWVKFGRSGTSVIRLFTRAAKAVRFGAALSRALRCRDLDQHPDQVRDIAARVVDVGLEQHAVARGLVELDVVFSPAGLELRAVEAGGAAHQCHARRVEVEFILLHALEAVAQFVPGARIIMEAGLAGIRAGIISSAPRYGNISRSADVSLTA